MTPRQNMSPEAIRHMEGLLAKAIVLQPQKVGIERELMDAHVDDLRKQIAAGKAALNENLQPNP